MSHIWMFVSASIFASTFMISQTAELADGLRDVLLRFHMGWWSSMTSVFIVRLISLKVGMSFKNPSKIIQW